MPVRKLLPSACAVATALLMLGAPQASQAASSSASISDIQFQLTDLTPDDQSAARYLLVNGYSFVQGDIGTIGGSDAPFANAANQWLAALSATQGYGSGVAGASTGSFGVFAYGQTSDLNTSYTANAGSGAGLHSTNLAGILLAPFTQVTISADVHLTSSLDALGCGAGCQQAGAQALVTWGGSTQDISLMLNGQTDAFAGPAYKDGLLSFTLTNNTSHWATNAFSFRAMADGSVTPVPEPESYALLGAGLAVVGLIARRRQRRQGQG
jgi:hypothetical protein